MPLIARISDIPEMNVRSTERRRGGRDEREGWEKSQCDPGPWGKHDSDRPLPKEQYQVLSCIHTILRLPLLPQQDRDSIRTIASQNLSLTK